MFVGDNIKTASTQWEFKGHVVDVFEEHIAKSVPLYGEGHKLVVSLSDYFVGENSVCYDIGSSTGVLSYQLATHHASKKSVRIIGIEKEGDMVAKAKVAYRARNLEFCNSDVLEFGFEKSSFIVSYYTLQFVAVRYRQEVVNRVYQTLEKGGAYVMFEKVTALNSTFQDMLNTAHFDFKAQNGYSHAEILAKALSIKGVLIPNTTEKNIELLAKAGFGEISPIMKYCNFEGYLAIK